MRTAWTTALLTVVALGGCDFPLNNPNDPARCNPRCSAGQVCYEGQCQVRGDGVGPADAPTVDGPAKVVDGPAGVEGIAGSDRPKTIDERTHDACPLSLCGSKDRSIKPVDQSVAPDKCQPKCPTCNTAPVGDGCGGTCGKSCYDVCYLGNCCTPSCPSTVCCGSSDSCGGTCKSGSGCSVPTCAAMGWYAGDMKTDCDTACGKSCAKQQWCACGYCQPLGYCWKC